MKNKKRKPLGPSVLLLWLSAALCCALLCLTSYDCEKYEKDRAVSASISFTAPKTPEEKGFWDILTLAIEGMLDLAR